MGWLRRRRKEKELAARFKDLHELREFVYLDEVSVTSLLSSREGAIPHEFTDSEGSTAKGELNAQAEASAGVFKGRIGSRYESTRSANSQVVSKATIQTLVKHLLAIEEDRLVLRHVSPSDAIPRRSEVSEKLATGWIDEPHQQWVVPVERLKRGELAEIEVELETDGIFQLSTIVSTFKELSDEYEELRAQIDPAVLAEFVAINNIVEKMMVGLIPLKCRVVDYVAKGTGQDAKLVHRRIISQSPNEADLNGRSIYLVGDTEQNLFWKDIRRVLFSGSRFRILCRLNNNGISSSWSPVKLADVLRKIDPTLSYQLTSFGAWVVAAMSTASAPVPRITDTRAAALQTYGELLAAHANYVLEEPDVIALSDLAQAQQGRFTSALEAREAFAPIQQWLEDRASTSFDKALAARFREEACQRHQLFPDGRPSQTRLVTLANLSGPSEADLIDVEIIAIYW